MGVVKRIQGWRDSRWPIPNTLQMLVGLIPYRDPEAFAEKKRADRESTRERAAIQENDAPSHDHRPGPPRSATKNGKNYVGPGTLSEPVRVTAVIPEIETVMTREPALKQGMLF